VPTRALHWSLSWARSMHSILSHPISLRSILVLSTFLLNFPPIPYMHSCYMACPSHPPWLDHSNYTWRREQVMKLSISGQYTIDNKYWHIIIWCFGAVIIDNPRYRKSPVRPWLGPKRSQGCRISEVRPLTTRGLQRSICTPIPMISGINMTTILCSETSY
jgi:hypothetical protein